MTKRIKLEVMSDDTFNNKEMIKISQSLFYKWNMQNEQKIHLLFGNMRIQCTCERLPVKSKNLIRISQSISKQLQNPVDLLPIHCHFNKNNNELVLGPIIACVTNINYNTEDKFSQLTEFLEELATYAERHHIFLFIKPIVDLDNLFDGYYYLNGSWVKDILPQPNVVYNRVGSRIFEGNQNYIKYFSSLDEQEIPYFNHRFLDKLEVNNHLVHSKEINSFLPNTAPLEDYDTFVEMLNNYETIYVKPVNGSKGKGILRIDKTEDYFTVYYSSFSEEVTTTFHSSYVLYKRILERIKKQPYLIQRGINLIKLDNRPIDFRILCIKNKEDWKVVSSIARISPKANMVSNIAQGGEQIRTIEVLKDLYDDKIAQQYMKQIHELALNVSSQISQCYKGLFGELGIDVALDEDGKPWIIEVNSKPSKIDDIKKEGVRPSTKALVSYLSFISGFPLI